MSNDLERTGPIVLPVVLPIDAAPRLVARKLSLKVSGSRPGSTTRPLETALAPVGPRVAPAFGLRVHSSPIVAPAVAPAARAPLTADDYASAEDYE